VFVFLENAASRWRESLQSCSNGRDRLEKAALNGCAAFPSTATRLSIFVVLVSPFPVVLLLPLACFPEIIVVTMML